MNKLSTPKPLYTVSKEKLIIENKEQLAKSLTQYGYRVQENARYRQVRCRLCI